MWRKERGLGTHESDEGYYDMYNVVGYFNAKDDLVYPCTLESSDKNSYVIMFEDIFQFHHKTRVPKDSVALFTNSKGDPMKKWEMPKNIKNNWKLMSRNTGPVEKYPVYNLGDSVYVKGKNEFGQITQTYSRDKKQYYYVVKLSDGSIIHTWPTEFVGTTIDTGLNPKDLKMGWEISNNLGNLHTLQGQYKQISDYFKIESPDEHILFLTELLNDLIEEFEYTVEAPTFIERKETYERFLEDAGIKKKIFGGFYKMNRDIRKYFKNNEMYCWYQDNGLIKVERNGYNTEDSMFTASYMNTGCGLWRRARIMHCGGRSIGLYDSKLFWGYFLYLVPMAYGQTENLGGFWHMPVYEGLLMDDTLENKNKLTAQNLRLLSDHLPRKVPYYFKKPDLFPENRVRDIRVNDMFLTKDDYQVAVIGKVHGKTDYIPNEFDVILDNSVETQMNSIEFKEDRNFAIGQYVRRIGNSDTYYIKNLRRSNTLVAVEDGSLYHVANLRKVYQKIDEHQILPDHFLPLYAKDSRYNTDDENEKFIILKVPANTDDTYTILRVSRDNIINKTKPEVFTTDEATLQRWEMRGVMNPYTNFRNLLPDDDPEDLDIHTVPYAAPDFDAPSKPPKTIIKTPESYPTTSNPIVYRKGISEEDIVVDFTPGVIQNVSAVPRKRGSGRKLLVSKTTFEILDLTHVRVGLHKQWDWELFLDNMNTLIVGNENIVTTDNFTDFLASGVKTYKTYSEFQQEYRKFKQATGSEREILMNKLVLGTEKNVDAKLTGSFEHLENVYSFGGLLLANKFTALIPDMKYFMIPYGTVDIRKLTIYELEALVDAFEELQEAYFDRKVVKTLLPQSVYADLDETLTAQLMDLQDFLDQRKTREKFPEIVDLTDEVVGGEIIDITEDDEPIRTVIQRLDGSEKGRLIIDSKREIPLNYQQIMTNQLLLVQNVELEEFSKIRVNFFLHIHEKEITEIFDPNPQVLWCVRDILLRDDNIFLQWSAGLRNPE